MSNLYENIDYMCKQNNLNITQMCKIIPISRSVFSELKSGRTKDLSFENRKLVASFFKVDIEYLDNDFCEIPCPLCGLQYGSNDKNEETIHSIRHKKWEDAVKKFGFCWNWQYRENVKARAKSRIQSEMLTSLEKVKCYEDIYRAYFSRALEANDYPLNYITYEEYVAGLLGNGIASPDKDTEEYMILSNKYGVKKGMFEGTYFNAGNTPIQSIDYLKNNKSTLKHLKDREAELNEDDEPPITNQIVLSEKETRLVLSYRNHPEHQSTIDKILDISDDGDEILIAARNGGEPRKIKMKKRQGSGSIHDKPDYDGGRK